jgi:tol-pal system protein YbgF
MSKRTNPSLRASLLSGACLGAALLVTGCASTPPEQDPVFLRLNDIDTRLAKVERILGNQSLVELAQELESLQADVRSLRGDLEQLQHTSESGRTQQRDLYTDLDKRLQALEGTTNTGPAPASINPPTTGAASTDKGYYDTAFTLLKSGQYDKAISAFQQFLAAFPDSGLADNAQYWLGEAYYVNKNFDPALKSFQRVVDHWPDSRKMPDALLKIGYCNYETKHWAPAREALLKVTRNYADAPAAKLAAERLDRMDKEGH